MVQMELDLVLLSSMKTRRIEMKKGLVIGAIVTTLIGGGVLLSLDANATDEETIDKAIKKIAKKDLESIQNEKSQTIPDLTEEKVVAVLADLREIARHNGYWMIARKHNVGVKQVIEIDKARKAKLSVAEIPK